MAAQDPKQEARFLRRWLRRRHPRLRKNGSITLLPIQARCFRSEIFLSLPEDFCVIRQLRGRIEFAGTEDGLRMTLRKLPFQRSLQEISAVELLMAFSYLGLPEFPCKLPELTHGFLRHSPTLHAVWTQGNKITVLHLIQVRKTVFMFLFPLVHQMHEPTIDAILYAASLPDQ